MQSDRFAGLVCFLIGAAYLTAGLELSGSVAGLASGIAGPSAYPRVLAGFFMLMSLALIAWPSTHEAVRKDWLAPIGVLVIGTAYVALLPTLGFLVTSLIAAPLLMLMAGERRRLWLAGGTLLLVFLIYFLFRHVLVVLLPTGSVLT